MEGNNYSTNGEVAIKCNGGTLKAYVYDDGCAKQAGVCYIPDGDTVEIDICLAEVKGPELANTPDNKDIDVYLYADPYDEGWTHNATIKHEDIMNALNDSEEEKEEK